MRKTFSFVTRLDKLFTGPEIAIDASFPLTAEDSAIPIKEVFGAVLLLTVEIVPSELIATGDPATILPEAVKLRRRVVV